jgi:hypothetical protein
MTDLKWPAHAIDDDAGDLAEPTATLLRGLSVLESAEDANTRTTVGGTPQSLQVITAGALQATKISGVFAGIGGLSGAATAAWAAFQAEDVSVRVALVGAVAVILAATVIAIALIVRSDVQSRSQATAAEYGARASIAGTFLVLAGVAQSKLRTNGANDGTGSSNGNGVHSTSPSSNGVDHGLLSCLAAFRTAVRPKQFGEFEVVTGVRLHPTGLQVRLESGDWIGVGEVEQFTSV